jgi:glycine dehydrogenase subunit 1
MLAGLFHMVCLGKSGLQEIAEQNLSKAEYLKSKLRSIGGIRVSSQPTFNEFVVETSSAASSLLDRGLTEGVVLGVDLGKFEEKWKHKLLVHASEIHQKQDLDRVVDLFQKVSR